MNKRNTLSNRQKDVITFIKKFIAKNGHSPSIREIAIGVHLNSPATVHVHVQNLIDMGYLKRDVTQHNSLILMVPNEFELQNEKCIEIPFIDKNILEDFEHELKHPDDTFYLPSQLIHDENDTFIYKIFDDKMKKLGIYPYDKLIVSRTNNITEKDIIVFQTNDFHINVNTFLFVNNNFLKKHQKITILGKVIGLYREY